MSLSKLKTMMAVVSVTVFVVAGLDAVGQFVTAACGAQSSQRDPPTTPNGDRVPEATESAEKSVPQALLKAKLDSAKDSYNGAWESLVTFRRFENQRLVPISGPEEAYTWSVRWLNAQREMNDNRDEHIAALEEHFKRMKELQNRVSALVMIPGLLPEPSNSTAEWYLAEAEHWLVKQKTK